MAHQGVIFCWVAKQPNLLYQCVSKIKHWASWEEHCCPITIMPQKLKQLESETAGPYAKKFGTTALDYVFSHLDLLELLNNLLSLIHCELKSYPRFQHRCRHNAALR